MESAGIEAPAEPDALDAFSRRLLAPENQSRLWIAEVGSDVVGWQALSLGGGTQILPVAQSSTYVDRNWQSRGVGRILLQHAQREAQKMGLWAVVGWIRLANSASIALVTSLGWSLIGPLPHFGGEPPQFAYYAYPVPQLGGTTHRRREMPN